MFGVTAHQAAPPAEEYVQSIKMLLFRIKSHDRIALEALMMVRQLMQHHHAKRVKAQARGSS